MVGGACILFLARTDKGTALHAGNVVDGGAVQVAAGQLLFVELNHFAGAAGLFAQGLQLFLGAVNPDDLVRGNKRFHVFKPL